MSKTKQPIDDFTPQPALIDERGPTTEWGRRTSFAVSDTGTITALQGPIERAVARGTLTHRQGRAAEKLYRHWFLAGLRGTTGSADPLKIFGTGMDASRLCATEAAVGHYEQFKRAIAEVRSCAEANGSRPDHAQQVLVWTVCDELTLADVGHRLPLRENADDAIAFPGKAGEIMARTILRSALNVLIKRWNL